MPEPQPAPYQSDFTFSPLRTNFHEFAGNQFIAAVPQDRTKFLVSAYGAVSEFRIIGACNIGVSEGQFGALLGDLARFKEGKLSFPQEVATAARIQATLGFWHVHANTDDSTRGRIRQLRDAMYDGFQLFGLNSANNGSIEAAEGAAANIFSRRSDGAPTQAGVQVFKRRDVFPDEPNHDLLNLSFPDSVAGLRTNAKYLSRSGQHHSAKTNLAVAVTAGPEGQAESRAESAERFARMVEKGDGVLAGVQLGALVSGIATVFQLWNVALNAPYPVPPSISRFVWLGVSIAATVGFAIASAALQRRQERLSGILKAMERPPKS